MFFQVKDVNGATLTVNSDHVMVVSPKGDGCNISLVDGRELRCKTGHGEVMIELGKAP